MRKFFSIILIGCLSMLFAEVFSGASQTWFINGWGLLVTFPLYLAHVLFFLNIAFKTEKISLPQLYFFGVLFALYESWITKVLWVGYFDAAGPALGTFLGLGISEFPILVFFWHPIMSFIMPILVYEILTGKALLQHSSLLEKSRKKSLIIILFLIAISTFIANGNQFNPIMANASLIGTLIIIALLHIVTRKLDILTLKLNKFPFIFLTGYLILLYIVTFLFLLPTRIPVTITPYLSILFFYILAIFLIKKSDKSEIKLNKLTKEHYSVEDLLKFSLLLIVSLTIVTLIPTISRIVLGLSYYFLSLVGVVIFALAVKNR